MISAEIVVPKACWLNETPSFDVADRADVGDARGVALEVLAGDEMRESSRANRGVGHAISAELIEQHRRPWCSTAGRRPAA